MAIIANRCSFRRLALLLCFFFVHLESVAGQYFTLENVKPVNQLSLSTIARYFVYANNGAAADAGHLPRPSFGWGLWDDDAGSRAELVLDGVAFKKENGNSTGASRFQLVVMNYSDFWEEFIPFQKKEHFCCPHADFAAGACPETDGLTLPSSLKDKAQVYRVPFTPDAAPTRLPIESSGVHFLILVNCSPEEETGAFVGSASVKQYYGNLSGIDVPKLELYALLTVVYVALTMIWVGFCLKFRSQLIPIHHYIGGVILIGLAEQVSWYVLFSKLNASSNSSTSDGLLFIAISLTTVKNVASIILILLASLGYCITRPTLETNTWNKVYMLSAAFLFFEGLRQLAAQYHVSLELSFGILLFCALPITLLYSTIFAWSFPSLQAILEELSQRKQMAKFRQVAKFRNVLILAIALFVISAAVETIVMASDIRNVWPYEWVFTDAVPNFLFLFVLVVMVVLWRPNRSSKYYSYNLEIPGDEIAMGLDANAADRIRTDIQARAFEGNFDIAKEGGGADVEVLKVTRATPRSDVRVWGELDLDLEEEVAALGAEASNA